MRAERDAAKKSTVEEKPSVQTNTTSSTETKKKDSDQATDAGKTQIDSAIDENETKKADETKNLNNTIPATNTTSTSTDSGE